MNTFTPWTIVVDLGIISALMLLGKLIRVKVKGIQKFSIPPAVLAGIMALVLGPEVLGWLPLSGSLGTYAGILIAFVFAALPFSGRRSRCIPGCGTENERGCFRRYAGTVRSGEPAENPYCSD